MSADEERQCLLCDLSNPYPLPSLMTFGTPQRSQVFLGVTLLFLGSWEASCEYEDAPISGNPSLGEEVELKSGYMTEDHEPPRPSCTSGLKTTLWVPTSSLKPKLLLNHPTCVPDDNLQA